MQIFFGVKYFHQRRKINMSDNPADDYSSNNQEVDLQMSDKASFREKSSSFLKLLEESSKYRKKDALPDPAGQKPGKRLDNLSPRPMPDANGNSEEATTPRLSRRPQEGGPLKKTNIDVEIEATSPNENKSRYSQFTELSPGPNVPPSTPRIRCSSVRPTPGVATARGWTRQEEDERRPYVFPTR